MKASDIGGEVRSVRWRTLDFWPCALVLIATAVALPLIGSPSTWLTLTVAGIAAGIIIFIVASGLTLVFGLMDVLNFGHGVFVGSGAYVAAALMTHLATWSRLTWATASAAILISMLTAALAVGVVGWAFERVVIRPVYGEHLKQILVTMGGMIVAEELIKVFWGPQQIPLALPEALRGAFIFPVGEHGAAVERFRLLVIGIGLLVLASLAYVLGRTKLGLLVRAGVLDSEMVEALGYRIRRLFVWVFVAGAALAGAGGALWGFYQQNLVPQIGTQVNVLVFVVIIMGGLGSTFGCFIGALLVGLISNYAGFMAPKLALFSTLGIMVLILLWRPQGLYPVTSNRT